MYILCRNGHYKRAEEQSDSGADHSVLCGDVCAERGAGAVPGADRAPGQPWSLHQHHGHRRHQRHQPPGRLPRHGQVSGATTGDRTVDWQFRARLEAGETPRGGDENALDLRSHGPVFRTVLLI